MCSHPARFADPHNIIKGKEAQALCKISKRAAFCINLKKSV
jgi:hypothetical protein